MNRLWQTNDANSSPFIMGKARRKSRDFAFFLNEDQLQTLLSRADSDNLNLDAIPLGIVDGLNLDEVQLGALNNGGDGVGALGGNDLITGRGTVGIGFAPFNRHTSNRRFAI